MARRPVDLASVDGRDVTDQRSASIVFLTTTVSAIRPIYVIDILMFGRLIMSTRAVHVAKGCQAIVNVRPYLVLLDKNGDATALHHSLY